MMPNLVALVMERQRAEEMARVGPDRNLSRMRPCATTGCDKMVKADGRLQKCVICRDRERARKNRFYLIAKASGKVKEWRAKEAAERRSLRPQNKGNRKK